MGPNDPMKLMAWNCRGLGGPSTISQLKESIRLYLADVIFVCENKQTKGFIGTVCKKLRFGNRWEVREPRGKKGGLLILWKDTVRLTRRWSSEFCIGLQIESESS